jgi:hypothetical protein
MRGNYVTADSIGVCLRIEGRRSDVPATVEPVGGLVPATGKPSNVAEVPTFTCH